MKYLLHTLVLLFFAQASIAQCPSGDITFTSQGQIDSFSVNYPGCYAISGNLKIIEQYQQPIHNITGLTSIQTISQKLKIQAGSLSNLSGFDNLTSIGKKLVIKNCSSLQNLDELSTLTHIGEGLDVSNCDSLLNIYGLENVSQLPNLTILGNQKLSECAITPVCNKISSSGYVEIKYNAIGCEKKETVSAHCSGNCIAAQSFFTQAKIDNIPNTCGSTMGTAIISGNDIQNLQGFINIDSIKGDLIFEDCNSLNNLQGLNNIKYISGDLIIKNCDTLFNLLGLDALNRIVGNFIIQNCDTLFNLQGLNSLSYIVGDFILGNDTYYHPFQDFLEANVQLSQLQGLELLDSIGGDFYINAPSLLSFSGLTNLKKVAGTIRIEDCSNITNFQGLESLIEVDALSLSPIISHQYQNYKTPKPNLNLQDFSGLENLTYLNHLSIGNNPNLVSFNGLQNIKELKSLKVLFNSSLSNFSGLDNLVEISEDFVIGDYTFIIGQYGGFFNISETQIQSFEGLGNLTTIGNFQIMNSNKLANFTGLSNLETIQGDFKIGHIHHYCGSITNFVYSNDTLNSFLGLSTLKKIGGAFSIVGKNKIKNFNYLSSLDSISGDLTVNSSNIESLSGASSLNYIGGGINLGNLRISFMDNFNDFTLLSFIDSIHGSLNIIDLDSIGDLSGFNNLKFIQQNLTIAGNAQLDNLDALNNLEYIGKGFSLGAYPRYQVACDTRWGYGFIGYPHSNPKLQSIEGLSNLKTIDSTFTFAGNDLIENLSALSSLEHIGHDINIGLRVGLAWNGLTPDFLGNSKLTDIKALQNAIFSKNIFLEDNPQLINLTGIGNRDTIKILDIVFCDSLIDLNGLNGIKNIDKLFLGYSVYNKFLGNKNIQSLNGLDNDAYVDKADIYNNPNLSTCGYSWLCDAILRENAKIHDNKEFCMSIEDLNCDDLVISGKVYYDLNQNKIKDNNEPNLPFQKVYFNPPGQTIYTNQNGNFFQYCDSSTTYTVNWATDSLWQLSTDSAQYSLVFSPGNPSNNHKEFGLFPAFPYHSEKASIFSNNTRCNEPVSFSILCQNTGTYVESGKVVLNYDASTIFVSAIDSTTIIDTINHRLIWLYDSLYQFKDFYKSASFLMPDQNSAGNSLYFHVNTYRDSSGTEILTDSYTYTPTVLCSFDPNDKQVMPSGKRDEHYTLHDQKLTYTVRFQNTGNAEAIDITIKDTIDTDLDINTLRIVNSSFPVQTTINGQAIEFLFKNIWLPDSTSNEPESHGFVTYEIQPQSNLDDYTEINNTAYIIFDFNDAIVTNTTTNTMVTMIPVALNNINKAEISIRPNPADDVIYILSKDNKPIDKVMIYNTLGQLMLTQNSLIVDVSHLPKGVYMVKVEIGKKIGVEKLIIE